MAAPAQNLEGLEDSVASPDLEEEEIASQPTMQERPALRPIPGPSALLHPRAVDALALAARPMVVAEVLSDGTLRTTDSDHAGSHQRRFSGGTLAGNGWTLWWQRRSWREEGTA